MSSSTDYIKILASRFVSLPAGVRLRVAEKLLRWREEREASQRVGQQGIAFSGARERSFLAQFWDEVEAAHGDGRHAMNPFAEEAPVRRAA